MPRPKKMIWPLQCTLAAFAVTVAIGVLNTRASAGPEIAVGQPFPGLTFPAAADGAPMSVHDFRGKRLMLHVFASW